MYSVVGAHVVWPAKECNGGLEAHASTSKLIATFPREVEGGRIVSRNNEFYLKATSYQ